MSAPLLLAVDAGGTNIKVTVVDLRGHVHANHAVASQTRFLAQGRVERDAETFWKATAEAIRRVLTSGIDPESIAAVGCTGFGNGIFLVDADGHATRPGIVSVDHRAQHVVDGLEANGLGARVSQINGHRLWGGQTIMLLAHLAAEEPETMARTRWALSCKDFIRMKLTGAAFTDPTDASGGGLTNVRTNDYDDDLLGALDIAHLREKLPLIVPSSKPAGTVDARAAAATGLRQGTPLAASMMDVAACCIGAGVTDGTRLVMISGTWSINCIESAEVPSCTVPLLNIAHRDGACRLIAEGSPASAANLTWYLDQAASSRLSFEEVNAEVAASPVQAARCHFLPFVHGPAPRQGAFLGLSSTDDEGTMLRALFEGVVFQHRAHAEEVLRHAGTSWPSAIRLAGGAAKSDVWTQIFADICQQPIEIVAADEIGAQGAAICAAVCAGLYPSIEAATRAMTRSGQVREPNRSHAAFYNDRFAELRGLDRGMLSLLKENMRDRENHQ